VALWYPAMHQDENFNQEGYNDKRVD